MAGCSVWDDKHTKTHARGGGEQAYASEALFPHWLMPAHPYLWTTCVTVRWLRDTRSLALSHTHTQWLHKQHKILDPIRITAIYFRSIPLFPTINLGKPTSKPLRSRASGRVWGREGSCTTFNILCRQQRTTSWALWYLWPPRWRSLSGPQH